MSAGARTAGAAVASILTAVSLGWAAPAPPPEPPPFPFAISGSFLGINVHEIDTRRAGELQLKEERGVEVTTVTEGSPAADAGLQKGDVVLEYNGQRVEGTEQFVRLVHETPPGRKVKFTVWRGGQEQALTVIIGERKSAAAFRGGYFGQSVRIPEVHIPEIRIPDIPRAHMSWKSQPLGIEAESVDGQLAEFFGAERGVLVRSVEKGSIAERAGIKAGDVITRIDQTPIDSPSDISRLLRNQTETKTRSLTIVRDRKETALNVTIDAPSRPVRNRARTIVQRQ
jgi:serine protease Do